MRQATRTFMGLTRRRLMGVASALAVVGATVWSAPAWSFSVEPLVYELSPSGPGSKATLKITNRDNRALSVEMRVFAIDLAADGKEVLTPADDDFLIFPPQAILPPDGVQTLRVQYIGESRLETSRSYRIDVAQLPLDVSEKPKDPSVAILVKFSTLANVAPPDSRARLSVSALKDEGGGRWSADIVNSGNRYARLRDQLWVFQEAGREQRVKGEELDIQRALSLPGHTRRSNFKAPAGFSANNVQVSIETAPAGVSG